MNFERLKYGIQFFSFCLKNSSSDAQIAIRWKGWVILQLVVPFFESNGTKKDVSFRDNTSGVALTNRMNSITFELFPGLCKTLHMLFRPNNSTGWAIFSEHFNRWQIVLWLVLDRPGEKARGKFKRYRICSIYR